MPLKVERFIGPYASRMVGEAQIDDVVRVTQHVQTVRAG
jgi:hypothetical protein